MDEFLGIRKGERALEFGNISEVMEGVFAEAFDVCLKGEGQI